MALVLKPGKANEDSCIVDEANVDGLFDFSMFHIIKQSEAQFLYKGPKIPKGEWERMLAFFKWTWETCHSESQARLYVNPAAGTWKVWVYPQEAKTGMSAREINDEEMQRQQASLGPEWMAFGTVHHHCNCSAFQSGTDEDNEKNQDGLHVTIGSMASKQYDIHARFYRKGRKFTEFPLSWFWDITEEIAEVPEWMWEIAPSDLKKDTGHKIAKYQMTVPPGADVTFPEEWKNNVKEIKTQPTSSVTIGGTPYFASGNGSSKKWKKGQGTSFGYSQPGESMWKKCQAAWGDIFQECFESNYDSRDMEICLGILNDKTTIEGIFAFACWRHKVDPDDLNKNKPTQKDFLEHDSDLSLVFAGSTEPKPTVTSPQDTPPTPKQINSMTDAEFAEYQSEVYLRGGMD